MRFLIFISFLLLMSLAPKAFAYECSGLFTAPPAFTYRVNTVSSTGLSIKEVISQGAQKITVRVDRHINIELLITPGVYPPTSKYYSGTAEIVRLSLPYLTHAKRVLVIGTGSGYEAVLLAKKLPNIQIDAIDINQRAVINSELNAEFHNLSEQINVFKSDLFSEVVGRYDAIIFHAPRPVDRNSVAIEDKFKDTNYFDTDGDIITRVLSEYKTYLQPNGHLFLLTEAEKTFQQPVSRLTTKPWSTRSPKEGQYSIFML